MRKRAAAILLALCMALTLLPTAAFATEEGGAAAPVEQPTQQEEKQEGQQEQPEETPEQPEEQPGSETGGTAGASNRSRGAGGAAVQSRRSGHCPAGGAYSLHLRRQRHGGRPHQP